ncbi:MAG: TIGR02647 family protein [bacterium]
MPKKLQKEMEVLAMFSVESIHEGIKVHSDADPDLIEATERLYRKGLISQIDGGYLTSLGIEARRHLDATLIILSDDIEARLH